ncbi:hypothetical protein BpHYR1_037358 [Brachionus plicatilis]|uniref:Uncharacterized protein n=1 Tax=Brachionus plicatilis TaxID=10195 RepID=A0A3M7PFY2_BRAPC|nr:hypothetical protein BpHYR1_037358 [Brachionus plicatilis]
MHSTQKLMACWENLKKYYSRTVTKLSLTVRNVLANVDSVNKFKNRYDAFRSILSMCNVQGATIDDLLRILNLIIIKKQSILRSKKSEIFFF